MDLAVLFVTHDLALISELSDEIAVMYAGEVVEQAPTAELFARPRPSVHGGPAGRLAWPPARRTGRPVAAGRPRTPGRPVPRRLPLPSPLHLRRRRLPTRARAHSRWSAMPASAGAAAPTSWRCPAWASAQRAPIGVDATGGLVTVALPPDTPAAALPESPVAELRGVSCHFTVRLPGRGKGTVHAVDDVDLAVARGTTLGLVGESGSGKSTLARVLLRLSQPPPAGSCSEGRTSPTSRGARLRTLRRRMQLVFQDPYSSFDPLATIGASVGEALAVHTELGRSERDRRVAELLDQVRLPTAFARRHPAPAVGRPAPTGRHRASTCH